MIGRPPRSTLFPYTPLSRPERDAANLAVRDQTEAADPDAFERPVRYRAQPADADPAQLALRDHAAQAERDPVDLLDRKSTRLNSSHSQISYAVFCLKTKNKR